MQLIGARTPDSALTYTLTSYEPPAAVNLGRSLNIGLVVFKGGQSDEAIFRFYLVSSVWNEKKKITANKCSRNRF